MTGEPTTSGTAGMGRRRFLSGIAVATGAVVAASCASMAPGAGATPSAHQGTVRKPEIQQIMRDAMSASHLRSIIVRVTQDGSPIHMSAMGESMTGVPATPDMHFRNGAVAFTYIATILLKLVDEKQVRLDDPLSRFLPALPIADRITLKMLANMTSGYVDYVYEPEVLEGGYADPFRQWTPEELIRIGTSRPLMYAPGTNWAYSHTNYVILGRVLEKAGGAPMATLMERHIIGPMGLRQTRSVPTPQIAEPVLHAFTSERREVLGIPASTPFYEESTFWNPSWTTAEGAIQTTDVTDLCVTAEAVGTGKLLSSASHRAQVRPELVGFGHADPGCTACRQNTAALSYGLGVLLQGAWVTQNKSFAGNGAVFGHLPAKKLAIAVVTTYAPEAFDSTGGYRNASPAVFMAIAKALAPDHAPPS